MMKQKLLYKAIATAALAACLNANGQNNFSYQAALTAVDTAAFYKIVVPPRIAAMCLDNFADLRIADDTNRQFPYIAKQEAAQFYKNNFIEFPVIARTREKDKQSHITIQNTAGKAIRELLLITTNTEARRVVNISGSNDNKQWYIIKEGIIPDNSVSYSSEERIQAISLPVVNYAYFQVTIIGADLLPFNITHAGIYNENFTRGRYSSIQPVSFVQKDSADKHTYIWVKFDERYIADKLLLTVKGPRYYKRQVNIYNYSTSIYSPVSSAFISSDTAVFLLNGLRSKQLLVEVENDDNQPLKATSVAAYQLTRYLFTYLEKGNYHIIFGDSSARPPVYDLPFFKDSLGSASQYLSIGITERNKNKPATLSHVKPGSKAVLWIIIGAVCIVLLVFTFKIIKEIEDK